MGKDDSRLSVVIGGANGIGAACCRLNYPGSRYAKDMLSHVPLGRRLEPDEIAEGVEFLASDRASAIAGTDLLIDAGLISAGTWGLYGGVPRVEGEAA